MMEVERKSTKKPKEPFFIDFLNGSDVDVKTLFAQDSKKSTLLSRCKEDAYLRNLLPVDVYFSWKDITRPFMKPQFQLNRVVSDDGGATDDYNGDRDDDDDGMPIGDDIEGGRNYFYI